MRGLSIFGVVLIVLGLISLFAGGFSYKDRDTTDLGPIDVTVTDTEHVRIPTVVSIGAVVLGVALLFAEVAEAQSEEDAEAISPGAGTPRS